MAIELKVPPAGESITEVVIGEWQKHEGDSVEADETIVIIETDKVTLELPAPAAGTLGKILKQEGDSAEVGEVIGYLEEGEASAAPSKEKEPAAGQPQAEAPKTEPKPGPKTEPKSSGGEARVMPAAARALADAGLQASDVEATGPGGRLLKEDVQRHLRQAKPAAAEESPATKAAAAPATASSPAPPAPTAGSRQEETVRMTTLRRRIAERLVEAQQNAALLTTFNEVDMSAIMDLRKAHQDAFVKKHGIKLGFMSFFIKAVIEGLKEIPALNAEIRDQQIVYRNYYDIGVAVGGGKGLVVPVIRNAERLSFAEIEATLADLAQRARDNRLELAELQGGTFTLSNGGIYGSLLSTPIINPPQSGILGMHAIKERPVAVDGQVVIRPMMYLAVTYDHRLVDGREAVTFLVRVKDCLEQPARMLLEV